MANRHRRREALHCCPACAASLGRRRRRDRGRPPFAWLGLLAVVAALVPVAAMDGGGGASVALAAPSPVIPDAPPAPVPARAPDEPAPSSRPARPPVEWRESLALGTPNGGALRDAVRLPSEGPGYYTYNPATQSPPGGSDRTWGTAAVVRQVIDLGVWWEATQPGRARLGIGDLSRRDGGSFTGPVVGHASHQNGLDVDIRLVRSDDAEAQVGPDSYDRAATQLVVDRLVAQGASLVLIGPSLDLHGPAGVVVRWPAHDDHLHVRFPDPDGTGN
ncbi:penicillin-insensitive murein endopeptidase [Miltoncostaea oceani]|uniref:penicillin-insensitive murein endopeptidase n=1 Tax=Miltoncostaea oceani TaxID=2843216 RepID=UPI001C3E20CD|nr:penicillin-insensitive murein endopeptidase [Miltoncostaea oceani]